MIKKIISFTSAAALLALIFTVSPAKADDTMTKSDFYAGGYGGRAWTNTDVTGGTSFRIHGDDGGLFVGYNLGSMMDKVMNINMQAGLEAHYGWSWKSEESGSVGGVPTSLSRKHEWGLDFKPGFAFPMQPTSLNPYAILGFRESTFRDSTIGNSTHNGFALGAGAELVTYQHFGVRLDYDHVFYSTNSGIDPHENDLRLGLAYHF